MILLKLSLLTLIVIFASNPNSKLNFLTKGIKNKRWSILMYFLHFVICRLLFAILVCLSLFVKSQYVPISLTGIQLMSVLIHLVKLYSEMTVYIQILVVRELNILFACALLLTLQFTNSTSSKYGVMAAWTNFGFTLIFCLISAISLTVKCALKLKQC